ncbi:hypothetical protein KIPB_017182, partial [Kipferlia bialata]
YADRAKKIKQCAVKNETPQERYIRELEEQIKKLQANAGAGGGATDQHDDGVSADQLAEYERLLADQSKSFEDRLAEAMEKERAVAKSLMEMGI